MPALPSEIASIVGSFAPVFSQPVWIRVQALICGAVLCSGTRTICSILRTLGLSQLASFQNYHRVFNRAKWSSLQASRTLLKLLVDTFVPTGPLVLGIDEVLERRWGPKIAARGIYRDSARSSQSFFVKSSGLRWISLHLLVPIPWAKRVWALPFLTVLAPSERYHKTKGTRHKTIIDWAEQMVRQVRRWWPERPLVLVGDATYAALELLYTCQALLKSVIVITRLRLDAALYAPAPKQKGKVGRPRLKGKRLPTLAQRLTDPRTKWRKVRVPWYGQPNRRLEYATGKAVWYHSGKPPVHIRWVLIRDPEGVFEPQALLSTDVEQNALEIVRLFMRRWPMEVTFQEVRTHLGLDGQRQWNERAIARTTPSLLGLFSIVTLVADRIRGQQKIIRPLLWAAWYKKELPTFSDALGWVRRCLWRDEDFWTSIQKTHDTKITAPTFRHLEELICTAA